jgi:hypothetical protein
MGKGCRHRKERCPQGARLRLESRRVRATEMLVSTGISRKHCESVGGLELPWCVVWGLIRNPAPALMARQLRARFSRPRQAVQNRKSDRRFDDGERSEAALDDRSKRRSCLSADLGGGVAKPLLRIPPLQRGVSGFALENGQCRGCDLLTA